MKEKIQLEIYLTDGFKNDTVIVRIDGNVEMREEGLTTGIQLGYAKWVPTKIFPGNVHVEVEIPTRKIRQSETLTFEKRSFLLVTVVEDRIYFNPTTRYEFL